MPLEPIATKRHPRRGMYVLPSLLTAGNIAAGFYAITQSIRGATGDAVAFDHAALAIGFAVLFDGLDGRVARMTDTSSDFGREFDSLADVITFGVAPSLLAYLWGVVAVIPPPYPTLWDRLHGLGLVVCFLFLISGACRLARFNISVNPQPRNPGSPIYDWRMSAVWLALIAATGFLMVSNWRFWSGKELNFTGSQPVRGVLLLMVVLALTIKFSQYALILIAMVYLLSGVLARLAYSWGRRKPAATGT